MGVSHSSNVSNAIASVTNDIGQQTTANTQQANNISQKITNNNCTIITKNYTADESGKTMQSNSQLSKAIQKSDVQNNIQQKLLQQASSTVGSMGLGYADANNTANMFVNSSTTIIDAMNTSCSQFSNINQSWTCDRSTIIADNVNINLGSTSDFLSQQVLDNNQVANVINDITQTADQKATASVEGLTGFLIGIALIIAALGYSVAKPLTTGSFKIIIAVVLIVILCVILAFMYVKKTPPFFNDDNECIPNDNIENCNQCINLDNKKLQLKSPPLRYIYDLTSLTSQSKSGANLLQMVISSIKNRQNGGYNKKIADILNTKLISYNKYGFDPLPDILSYDKNNLHNIPEEYLTTGTGINLSMCTPGSLQKNIVGSNTEFIKCPSIGTINDPAPANYDDELIMASLNDDAWNNYKTPHFARYVLCDMLSIIPLNTFIDQEEIVNIIDKDGNKKTGKAKDFLEYSYRFITTESTDFKLALVKNGQLSGLVGICNNNNYKLHHFVRTWGVAIIIILILGTFAWMYWTSTQTYKDQKDQKDQKNQKH